MVISLCVKCDYVVLEAIAPKQAHDENLMVLSIITTTYTLVSR